MEQRTDQQWVSELKAGEYAASRALWGMVFRWAVSGMRIHQQVVEGGLEAAVAAYYHIRERGVFQYKFACSFVGYCRQVVAREVLRHGAQETPLEQMDRQTVPGLQPCLEQLSGREWEVIGLLYDVGQTPEKVAEVLHLSRNSVQAIAHRARLTLQACLPAQKTESAETRSRLVRDILLTKEHEIQCGQAAVEMVRATAVPLSEGALQEQYPQLVHHMQLCVNCAAEYKLLREMILAERMGEETVISQVPLVPVERPRMVERLSGGITAVFDRFPEGAPSTADDVSLGTEPVDVDLPEGELAVTLDVDVNEQNSSLRNLFVTVMPRVELALEGATMALWSAKVAHLISEATLDALGEGAFLQVPVGRYDMVWSIGGAVFVIEGVTLP